uniref:Myb/SANT-like DNA-binding domain-containing protein n=1 Tax=Astyanax mexicanus TaxID=7994 RepID=A0A8B9KM76_ASTMX
MLTTMTYRMPNFTLEQKLYLLQKIHSVVDAVQDFRKDTNTTVYRNAVWAELAQAFNEAFPNRPPSSVGSLKTLWKRLKVECRVELLNAVMMSFDREKLKPKNSLVLLFIQLQPGCRSFNH